MTYQLLLNNNLIFQTDLVTALWVGFTILVLFVLLIVWLIKTLEHSESTRYEFITIVAHKFRTPLTQVRWFIESMIANEADPYKKERLTEIEHSNDKLIKLTNTLIEMTERSESSKASYSFEKVNISELISYVADTAKTAFHEKNIFFSAQHLQEEIYVRGDRSRLEFVMQTLIENACAYTPPGRNVDVRIVPSRRSVVITVVDTGIGIKPEDLPKIFTKFFRTDVAKAMDTEGFGVGLSLVRAVIKRHHGKIEVRSEGLDRGTTFTITLPRVKK